MENSERTQSLRIKKEAWRTDSVDGWQGPFMAKISNGKQGFSQITGKKLQKARRVVAATIINLEMAMNALEENLNQPTPALRRKDSMSEATTSTPMGYITAQMAKLDIARANARPKWMPFCEVDEGLNDDFIPAEKTSPRSSNESLFEATESSDVEDADPCKEVPSEFHLLFKLVASKNGRKSDQKISIGLSSYILSGEQVRIDLSASKLQVGSQGSSDLEIWVGVDVAGVTAWLPPLPVATDFTGGRKVLRKGTVSVLLEASSEASSETLYRPVRLEMPAEEFEEMLSRRFDLLTLNDSLGRIVSVMDIHGIIEELSQTNLGSRTVQRLLAVASQEETDALVSLLQERLHRMAMDSYGNYVFQKLLQNCSTPCRLAALERLLPQLPAILQTKTGTHSLQSLVDSASCLQELQLFLQGISGHQVALSCNQQSTHFIQRLLVYPAAQLHQTVYEALELLAQNQFGVIVVKTFMEVTSHTQWRYHIIHTIMASLPKLIQHQFAHYLVQEAFELYGQHDTWALRQSILDQLVLFSCGPYSSGVIEKMLNQYCNGLSSEVLGRLDAQPELLLRMLENKSGSFVIHRVLDSLVGQNKSHLDQLIVANIPKIGGYQSRNKWAKYYGGVGGH